MRWDPDKTEKILVLGNLTNESKKIDLNDSELPIHKSKTYSDIISEKEVVESGMANLNPFQVIWIRFNGD